MVEAERKADAGHEGDEHQVDAVDRRPPEGEDGMKPDAKGNRPPTIKAAPISSV
jgi:hypothetical protein